MLRFVSMLTLPLTVAATAAAAEPSEGSASATAESGTDVSVGVLTEDQNSVQSMMFIAGAVSVSHRLGDTDWVGRRVGGTAAFIHSYENSGGIAELGGAIEYYGRGRTRGVGVELGAALSFLWLEQTHDRETLMSLGAVVDPAVVVRGRRFAVFAGPRVRVAAYEAIDDEMETTTEMPWRLELGLRAGVRVAF